MEKNDPFIWKNEWSEANNVVVETILFSLIVDLLGATQEQKSTE